MLMRPWAEANSGPGAMTAIQKAVSDEVGHQTICLLSGVKFYIPLWRHQSKLASLW